MVMTNTTEMKTEEALRAAMVKENIAAAEAVVIMEKAVTSTQTAIKTTMNMEMRCTFLKITVMRAEGEAIIKTRRNSVNSMLMMKPTFSMRWKSSTTTTFASLSERANHKQEELR